MTPYTPDRGDIIWIQLTAGPHHSQATVGQSPVLVISPRAYNQATGLLLACPITSQVKSYPFEVAVAQGFIDGVILADQITTLDWTTRKPRMIMKITPETLATTLSKLNLLLQ